MCIGGVFGGINSGVSDSTTSIFLESAHFHPAYIRRSSMHHNLRTDAAKVFEKGSDPNICVYALKRAALLMQELAGGVISSAVIDLYPNPIAPVRVTVSYDEVSTLIGIDLEKSKIHEILDALDMERFEENEDSFGVLIPTNKSDVTRPADVIEEILRIYGLNSVPVSDRISMSLSYDVHPSPSDVRNLLGNLLAANGFIECMNLSISQSTYYNELLPVPQEELVFIHNTSNVSLDVMRPSMLIPMLETVAHNQNRQQLDLKLFEFGKQYRRSEDGFEEEERLVLTLTGKRQAESWLAKEQRDSDIFTLKAFVQQVLQRVGITSYQEETTTSTPYSYAVQYKRGQDVLVTFGQVEAKVVQALGTKTDVFYADFAAKPLFKSAQRGKLNVQEPVKFPSMRRDLALVVAQTVKFQDIALLAAKTGKKLLKAVNLFDVYENEEQLGAGKKSYAISLTFEDAKKTLKDKEVDNIMQQLIRQCEQQLGAVVRR
jgi:phenylalanyl-tRNA synthetase beta chain